MLPTTGSPTDKSMDKTQLDSTQVDVEDTPSMMNFRSKRTTYALTVIILACILVAGVFGSIYVYGKYGKKETTKIVYRKFEDNGVKHSMEIVTKDADRVETVIFEKIDNVTEGGTLMFDFNQKLVAAYSDKDDACYLWVDESLDWNNRDWLYNGDSPSFFFTKEDEIPSDFLRRVVVDEIADKCFGVKTYWAVMAADQSLEGPAEDDGAVATDSTELAEPGGALSRNRRGICVRFRCRFGWRRFRCTINVYWC